MLAVFLQPSVPIAAELPEGFVYLSEIEPGIVQDMRYAGFDNFTHRPVAGYLAGECVLTRQAATALGRVSRQLRAKGFGLKVWDCYRPAKAVRNFNRWARSGSGFDVEHYPRVARNRLVAEGYIGKRSGHSAGSTVDLTLVGPNGEAIDMGTGFDFFDPLSHTDNPDISSAARANRAILLNAMRQGGFRNYPREWWHFTLVGQPFAGKSLDFDIHARE